MSNEVLQRIQTLFFERLNKNPTWGKNQIKELYKDIVIEVLLYGP